MPDAFASDVEIAFPAPKNMKKLPKRGILAAEGLGSLRAAAPSGGADLPPILGGRTRLTVWPDCFLAGPVLGAPMAVMALEELLRRGAEEVVFFGLAGSLDRSLPIGVSFLPDSGLSTEGTSAHYPAPLAPDSRLRQALAEAGDGPEAVVEGAVWSTDGIYRETAGLVARQREAGAGAVDMEATALFAAAGYRKIRLAALLVISDILDGFQHETGFQRPEFKKGLSEAAGRAWQVMASATLEEGLDYA